MDRKNIPCVTSTVLNITLRCCFLWCTTSNVYYNNRPSIQLDLLIKILHSKVLQENVASVHWTRATNSMHYYYKFMEFFNRDDAWFFANWIVNPEIKYQTHEKCPTVNLKCFQIVSFKMFEVRTTKFVVCRNYIWSKYFKLTSLPRKYQTNCWQYESWYEWLCLFPCIRFSCFDSESN